MWQAIHRERAPMFSKTDLEGYLEIDHRDSPGITPQQAFRAGRYVQPVAGGTKFQSATYNCCGCERLIVKHPLRVRERHYCTSCDRYMCDECTTNMRLTGVHVPFKKLFDLAMEAAVKGRPMIIRP